MRKQDELKKLIEEAYPYRTELHAHTKPVSTCSDVPPEEAVRLIKKEDIPLLLLQTILLMIISIKESEQELQRLQLNFTLTVTAVQKKKARKSVST